MDVPTESPLDLHSGPGARRAASHGSAVDSGPDVGPDTAVRSVAAASPAARSACLFPDRPDRGGATAGGCVSAVPGMADTAAREADAIHDTGAADVGVAHARGVEANAVDAVDALLPQTQCRRCGFDACRPYAEALVRGEANINRCPPGGEATVAALARALGRPVVPLDPARGPSGPRETARIVESECIGCTVCIRACPVDAIIGARKWMHAVLENECTGCGLCVEPCPVDCIALVPARTGPATPEAWLAERAPLARRRFERRRARESALDPAPHRRERADRIGAVESLRTRTVEQRRADIAAAVERVRARKSRMKSWSGDHRGTAVESAGRPR